MYIRSGERAWLVQHFLENAAMGSPEREALFAGGAWFRFGELEGWANTVAERLLEAGVRRGDRVALLLHNSPEYVVAYYGVLKSGAIVVPLNTDLLADRIASLLEESGAGILLSSPEFLSRLRALPSRPSCLRRIVCFGGTGAAKEELADLLEEWPVARDLEASPRTDVRIIDEDVASIVFTSGSTGRPRGAVLRHRSILANTASIVEYLRLTREDRVLAVLPFYYIYGKSLLNTHFSVGGSVVVDNRFAYPNAVLNTLRDQECTGFAGVPSTYAILLGRSALRDYRFPSLRYVTQAGGAMAPEMQREVSRVFAPARLFVMYGATEASARLSFLDPDVLPGKWGSIGRPIPNVELFVADEEGNRLPQGEVGELVARGSNLMEGYWNDPEETARVLRNGLYFTGDLGREDEEGYLFVVGRKKEMIKCGAHRVSAKEIEECLLAYPGVVEAAAVAIPDPILGEVPVCFVSCIDSLAPVGRELLDHCRRRLESFKMPSRIEVLPELPKKASQKVDKEILRRLAVPADLAGEAEGGRHAEIHS